jgi:hypothetical protein
MDEQDLYELDLCIRQHGEAARELFEQAAVLEDMCLVPNFGFDPALESAIDEVTGGRDLFCRGIVDVAVFAKPRNTSFDKEMIDPRNAANLFWFTTELYAEVLPEDFESWNESDILQYSQLVSQEEFCQSMREEIAQSDNPPSLEQVEVFLNLLTPKLFSNTNQRISRYYIKDPDRNFLPLIFIGVECLLVIAKWQD